jgi:hypothetical protein
MTTKAQQRKNRLALADMLENRISDKNFRMEITSNECGTVGCALGIAVLSGEFGYGWNAGYPVKDGQQVGWMGVGIDLFGDETTIDIFWNTIPRSRQTVAAELREIK